MLVDLSNIFNTDINLFDREVTLLPHQGRRSFTGILPPQNEQPCNLKSHKPSKDRISSKRKDRHLEFVSAYVPFQNQAGEFIAFLNLPYFRMQSVLAREISNMIVAVINFTLLLG